MKQAIIKSMSSCETVSQLVDLLWVSALIPGLTVGDFCEIYNTYVSALKEVSV